ncbi:glutamate--cysteine ligase [Kocuria rosea]|uniref:glutamate--cysteine ligase n=1 Tax=Kocuria rosea TaxID=1275 RepID=UPI0011A201C2|nr:glutamate--cysteine ligase [Kocuria rosea]
MRSFGVEEELLLIEESSLQPMPIGQYLVDHHGPTGSGHRLGVEFQQEQLEVVNPPCTSLGEQLETIRAGRALADAAAGEVGGRAVALATAPAPATTHLVPEHRFEQIAAWGGITSRQQLTGGLHIHVQIDSREEGVAILDRIRIWLPTLLAISSNSPYWDGTDTGFHSYRYQLWNRWPATGPTDIFGSATAYDRHCEHLLASRVPLDPGMLYFDARLSAHHPTVEIRVADVCWDPEHAAVLATLVRALAEASARRWRAGHPPAPVSAGVLRAWMWQASRCGLESYLINPHTGTPAPAGDVVTHLLEHLHPVLTEYAELDAVETVLATILREGTGAHHQRQARRANGDLQDVTRSAITPIP